MFFIFFYKNLVKLIQFFPYFSGSRILFILQIHLIQGKIGKLVTTSYTPQRFWSWSDKLLRIFPIQGQLWRKYFINADSSPPPIFWKLRYQKVGSMGVVVLYKKSFKPLKLIVGQNPRPRQVPEVSRNYYYCCSVLGTKWNP